MVDIESRSSEIDLWGRDHHPGLPVFGGGEGLASLLGQVAGEVVTDYHAGAEPPSDHGRRPRGHRRWREELPTGTT